MHSSFAPFLTAALIGTGSAMLPAWSMAETVHSGQRALPVALSRRSDTSAPLYVPPEQPEAGTFAATFSERASQGETASGIWAELAALRNLEEDWDGYGAPKLSAQAIDDAESFLNQLVNWDIDAYPPTTMAMSDGSLALKWSDGAKYLEIGFDGGNHPYLLFLDQRVRKESHPGKAMATIAWRANEILKTHFIDFESALAA